MMKIQALLLLLSLSSCAVLHGPETATTHTYKVTVVDRSFFYGRYSVILYGDAELDAFKEQMLDEGFMPRSLRIEQIN